MLPYNVLQSEDEACVLVLVGVAVALTAAVTLWLTDDGHSLFAHAYDDIAVEALGYLRDAGGDAAVSAFARQRLHGLEVRYAAALAAVPADRRPARSVAGCPDLISR